MIMHEITLDGYAAQCAEQPIRLGTEGSYGVETLRVLRKGEWVDYDIIVAFHPPKGESVQMRLGSDNVVSVPAEATAVAGTGELTFAGYTDGVRQISMSQSATSWQSLCPSPQPAHSPSLRLQVRTPCLPTPTA